MLKRQNNLLKLFCKLNFYKKSSIIILAVFCFLIDRSLAFSLVSSQQCDKELEKYCQSDIYNNSEERIKCVKEKQNYFTYECVVRILGIETYNTEEDADNKLLSVFDQKNKQNVINKTSSKEQFETNLKIYNNEQTIKQQQNRIATLIENILRKRCIGDIVFLCKTKIRRGNVIVTESLDSCINKMIKNDFRLSFDCYNAIQDILDNPDEKQNMPRNVFITNFRPEKRIKRLAKKRNYSNYLR